MLSARAWVVDWYARARKTEVTAMSLVACPRSWSPRRVLHGQGQGQLIQIAVAAANRHGDHGPTKLHQTCSRSRPARPGAPAVCFPRVTLFSLKKFTK